MRDCKPSAGVLCLALAVALAGIAVPLTAIPADAGQTARKPPAARAEARSPVARNTRPLVVDIHADWCSSCRRIEGTLDSLQKRYGKDVEFLILDVTDARRAAQAEKTAKNRGLTAFFNEHKAKTSTVGIFAPRSASPAEILIAEGDPEAYAFALGPMLDKKKPAGAR